MYANGLFYCFQKLISCLISRLVVVDQIFVCVFIFKKVIIWCVFPRWKDLDPPAPSQC